MHRMKLNCHYILEFAFLLLAALWVFCAPPNAIGAMDYLSTGIGIESREAHPEYSLKLEFTLQAGNYLAGIDVDIYRNGKKIKSIHSPEPWLYVNLEPGTYTVVVALEDGRKQGAEFSIAAGRQKRLILSWPGE